MDFKAPPPGALKSTKAVLGKFYRSGGHSKRNYSQVRVNLYRSRAQRIVLIFNTVYSIWWISSLYVKKNMIEWMHVHKSSLNIKKMKCMLFTLPKKKQRYSDDIYIMNRWKSWSFEILRCDHGFISFMDWPYAIIKETIPEDLEIHARLKSSQII